MLSDDVYDYIKGKGTAKTETQLNILLQVLVGESIEEIQNNRSPRSKEKWDQIQFYKDMLQQKAVTSFELEKEVNRMTFSRNKQYLLENYLLESHQRRREHSQRPWTYYNTTPLGKVLAMRFWYQKREPQEIKMKVGGKEKRVNFEPADFLSSFFEYLPRLKKYSKTIKESSSTELGPNIALKHTFSSVEIIPLLHMSSQSENTPKKFRREKEIGIEVKFRSVPSITKREKKKEFRIIKYFIMPKDPEEREAKATEEMYNYILDSLTFIFLRNLETIQTILNVENPVRTKILNDPDLRLFYQQYKMERQQDLQESLNFLSDDN